MPDLEQITPIPMVRDAPRVTLGDILPPPPEPNPEARGVTAPQEPSLPTPKTEVDADLQREGWRTRIGEGYGARERFLREWRG